MMQLTELLVVPENRIEVPKTCAERRALFLFLVRFERL